MVEKASGPKELSKKERLSIIESTPYLINDPVLLKDLKWLISEVKSTLPEEGVPICGIMKP